ncbi:cbb3-type cytochrome c oxidase subunit III [Fluviicoccus keumensis]|uniref:Cbb3-type cytochrome c oxidase subunit III n=1 Tax=Fluviicoccus keumensis TaxID=1435465 RepID=A0A4Q7ZB68_9GAMM|nr:c-type cytochrome [Fluviicoccus keumensis]RZU47847.1 cbb3-type cytochrome c oxidase subunit III [Fluviicoccus keumensis]
MRVSIPFFCRTVSVLFVMVLATAAAPARASSGKAFYNQICSLCHDDGGDLGAPVLGDRQAWAPRLAKGRQPLYRAAILGMPGSPRIMPGKNDYEGVYSDRQVKAAVDYMIRQSR